MNQPSNTVKVFDTWVQGKTGTIHFDVMTTDEDTALCLAKTYLASLGEGDAVITTKECQFCHNEPLAFFSQTQQQEFTQNGGFILSMPSWDPLALILFFSKGSVTKAIRLGVGRVIF